MSVEIVKSISVKQSKDGNGYDIAMNTASSNVTPRWYAPYTAHTDDLAKWLREFAVDLFNGGVRFLPSAHCRMHQAYQIALKETGGDWSYAWNQFGNDTPEYKAFRARFVDAFLKAMGERYDHQKYVITLNGKPIYMKACRPNERAEVTRYSYAPWRDANKMSLETALLLVNNFASYTPFAEGGLHGTLGYAEAHQTERARQAQRLATA